jgi:hypothetical protein
MCVPVYQKQGSKEKSNMPQIVTKLQTLKLFPAILLISLDAEVSGEIDW